MFYPHLKVAEHLGSSIQNDNHYKWLSENKKGFTKIVTTQKCLVNRRGSQLRTPPLKPRTMPMKRMTSGHPLVFMCSIHTADSFAWKRKAMVRSLHVQFLGATIWGFVHVRCISKRGVTVTSSSRNQTWGWVTNAHRPFSVLTSRKPINCHWWGNFLQLPGKEVSEVTDVHGRVKYQLVHHSLTVI